MFRIGSFYYKMKAKAALKKNWQTAMLVAFFASIFFTALQVFQLRYFQFDAQQLTGVLVLGSYEQFWELLGITKEMVYGLLALTGAALLVSPALTLGRNHYFISRIRDEELGFAGLFSRMSLFLKALWLNILIFVKCLLWGLAVLLPVMLLIFFVPGVAEFMLKYPLLTTMVSVGSSIPVLLATLRYSMAAYIMADKPETGAWRAIEQSKKIMANQKMNYFALNVSFVGWLLLSSVIYMLVGSINMVAGLVAQLFFDTWLSAYMNGALACFYDVVSDEAGESKALADLKKMMQKAGVEMPDFSHFDMPQQGFGEEKPEETLTEEITEEKSGEETDDGEETKD